MIRARTEIKRLIDYNNELKVENRRLEERKDETMTDENDGDITLKCSHCDFGASSEETMKKHQENHPEALRAKCENCELDFETEAEKDTHKAGSHLVPSAPPLDDSTVDSRFTCDECPYQTNQYQHLLEHIEMQHKIATVPVENNDTDLLKCKDCPNKFPSYATLMKHRKQKHPKLCKNFPKGKCTWGNDCYWVHPNAMYVSEPSENQASEPSENIFKCHICAEIFASKNALMRHKKSKHSQSIKCRDFPNCNRSAEDCWYRHDTPTPNLSAQSAPAPTTGDPTPGAPSTDASQEQVFRHRNSPQQPPDQMKQLMEMMVKLQQQMNNLNQDVVELKMQGN